LEKPAFRYDLVTIYLYNKKYELFLKKVSRGSADLSKGMYMLKRNNNAENNEYGAYLLRLWREGTNAPWRFSLQEASSGEKYGFSDLEQMNKFLRARMTGQANAPPGGDNKHLGHDP